MRTLLVKSAKRYLALLFFTLAVLAFYAAPIPATANDQSAGPHAASSQDQELIFSAGFEHLDVALLPEIRVKGQLDSEWVIGPRTGLTFPNGDIEYVLSLTNSGSLPVSKVVIMDILPFIGDTGVVELSSRGSVWKPTFSGLVEVDPGAQVFYSLQSNPCRQELSGAAIPFPAGCTDADWSAEAPAQADHVRAIKVEFGDRVLNPGEAVAMTIIMTTPVDVPLGGDVFGDMAWNSFAGSVKPLVGGRVSAESNRVGVEAQPGSILVFSKTAAFRHASIADGKTMLANIAGDNGWNIDFTEDSSQFNEANLSQYSVVVWLSTTGDVLNENEQAAFQNYIESGFGYVGIHAASDTEYYWPWYGELIGSYFNSHPQIQQATIEVEDLSHESTRHLGPSWILTDEWYNFQNNPRTDVNVLMSLDETSYEPGEGAMGDHPIAWYRDMGAGRSFYTGLGHVPWVYQNQDFIAHIEGALRWAGRLEPVIPPSLGEPPPESDFKSTVLASNLNQPMELDISDAGDLYVIGREGQFYALEGDMLLPKSYIPTNSSLEGGLIGFALDPNFSSNRFGYFHYTDAHLPQQHVSRITINSDNTLNLDSEQIILSYPVQLDECCHVGGSMDFDSDGNLYISIGDNTNPHASDGYTPIDERNGRSAWDAQRTSANTNDLRGKILRIRPTVDGYIIPEGNLFAPDGLHRGEIFTMGHRNPFRIAIDPATDQLFWGEIGPDASGPSAERGPGGYDELNKTAFPGNFGWPYFSGENEAYNDYDFATSISGPKFDPFNVVNDSPNNTGATNLPLAQPAWVTMSHRALMVLGVYRWDSSINDPTKLPSYFHGRLIYWNFNDDEMYSAAVDESHPDLQRWINVSVMDGIIDGVISPENHHLYLISFGGNCCGRPNDAGLLVEVEYTGDGSVVERESSYAINAGGDDYLAVDGTQFLADDFYSGGEIAGTQTAISGTLDDPIFQTHRWRSGGFSYDLPIENGDYNVTLQFAETFYDSAGAREFHVDAENARKISNIDVFAAVGPNAAYSRTFRVTVSDGSLDLDFVPGVQNPLVSGIKISEAKPSAPGNHITLNAAVNGQYVTTQSGNLIASAETATDTEIFLLVDAGNELVALQSVATGLFVTVLPDTALSAASTSVGESEKFSLVQASDKSFALLAALNGKFVSAENAGTGNLVANREAIGLWEKFDLAMAELCDPDFSYAIACRPNAKAYLDMPPIPAPDLSNIPPLLSLTGAFTDVETMTTIESMIPYEPIAPLWSDRAVKSRWLSVPSGTQVGWAEEGKWQWPAGTVFVKHFALPTDESDPSVLRRLETRLIVMMDDGLVYGVTYKWREDYSDAELLTTGLTENIPVTSPDGDWVQTWSYPSPNGCLKCHNTDAKGVLGLKTASLNGDYGYPSGATDNQLVTLNHLLLFSTQLDESEIAAYPAHAYINDEASTLEHRVRSYWDINCGSCHGPQGIAALWDARYETPLVDQGVINGALANLRDYEADYGLEDPKVVDPGNIHNSIMYIRDKSLNQNDRMPPLGSVIEDSDYLDVLEQWINSLD